MLVSIMLACQQSSAGPAPCDPAEETHSTWSTSVLAPPDHTQVEGDTETPLLARLSADVVAGVFPLEVTFDASASLLGSGHVSYEWSFGDGAGSADVGGASHTYIGAGAFVASLALVDDDTGEVSVAEVTIDVATPSCPSAAAPVTWGTVSDGGLTELSGIAASRRDPSAYWVHEDSGMEPFLVAIDDSGATLSRHELPDALTDLEDLETAVDPETGAPMLFLGDIGDNGYGRDEVVVWVFGEPDPRVDGTIEPLRMALAYPEGARNAETLLVDPLTLDLYIVTKQSGGVAEVYVKRAPHDGEGPYALENLGERETLPITATGGDVSADGSWVVVRDYTETALLFPRDGYLPLEDAFDAAPCELGIAQEGQGEAIGFTADGAGVVTVSEGGGPSLYYIGL